MSVRSIAVLTLLAALVAAPSLSAQDTILPTRRPVQVTDSAVARGGTLFHGPANCVACHGPAGVGTDSGTALAQGIWMHGEDSYEGILSRVVHGIPKELSTRGTAMPMRGWNTMTNAEARDVAAYVWTISHAWQLPVRQRSP